MTDAFENIGLLVALLASGASAIVVLVIMLLKFADFLENGNE